MRIVLFCHSIVSDWNHGNAHFLRGVTTELIHRGHELAIYEPRDAWSRTNLVAERGPEAEDGFRAAFPHLSSELYDPAEVRVDPLLEGADVVLVHEWTDHRVVEEVGRYRAAHPDLRVLFHDTHHRAATAPDQMSDFDLTHYDGVLAFGDVIRRLYLENGWSRSAWTWHEAADVRLFHPLADVEPRTGLVWVGNWGDEERTAELHEFLLGPVGDLGLDAIVHGVRYPAAASEALAAAGITYHGWIPNHEVPRLFASARLTVHVPRRPYVRQLPGIPTIRVFEALACGIPLVCSPWRDPEGLFRAGTDFLMASDREEMTRHIKEVLNEPELAAALAASGRERILSMHTCGHRVDELLSICRELGLHADTDLRE